MSYRRLQMEPETRQLCWSGSGKAITKTVSCAEIMKRKIKGLHQVTKIRTRRVEEYWEPKLEGLERLKVNRDIPAISVLLSKDPLDQTQPGYQAPGSFDEFWTKMVQNEKAKSAVPNKNGRKRKFQNEKSQKQKNFGEKSKNRQNDSVNGDKKNESNSPHSNIVKDDATNSSATNI